MLRRLVVAMFLSACSGSKSSTSDAGLPDDVRATKSGPVRGAHLGSSLVFKGIPYAAQPERWKPAIAPPAWSNTRDALAYGPSCVQVDEDGGVVGSEDCLSLNVWTPFNPPSAPLPVLVFIHGGNNQTGCSCDTFGGLPYYDGESLSEHGPAVVVTLNYRLAAFGFLADPIFAAESARGSTGDYGLRDQLLALQWVQDNITAFGGAPTHVMAFGHSAGSLDLAALVASPLAAGLFQRAVLHSGASVTVAPTTVQTTWMGAEKALGCDTASDRAACLRAASVSALARVPGAALGGPNPDDEEYDPTIDVDVLPATPLQRARAGAANKIPMMLGTTSDEYAQLVTALVPQPLTTQMEYEAQVNLVFGDALGALVLAQYPTTDYANPEDAFVAILGDLYETCPTRQLARALAGAAGQPPLYRFIYTHTFPGALAQYRAAHAFDVFELFHDIELVDGGPVEVSLADAMARYWSSFAATGDPNDGVDLAWAPYVSATDNYQQLDWPLDAGAASRATLCDFWESQGLGQ